MRAIGWMLGGLAALAVLALALGYGLLRRPDVPFETLEARYATPASQMIDLGDGVVAHYRDEGAANGRTLLLIHGFLASERSFDGWAEALSPMHRVVRLDLPGHGLTRAPATYDHTPQAYAATVNRFANRLGLGPVVVVGHSLGGEVAWRLAQAHPERVGALVLVAAAGWPDPRGSAGARAAQTVLGPLDASAAYAAGLRAAAGNDAIATEERVERELDFTRAPGRRPALRRLAAHMGARPPLQAAALQAISAPALVLQGARDPVIPVAHAHAFGAALPNAIVSIYPDLGHFPQEEDAARTAGDLAAFLAQLPPFSPFGQPIDLSAPPAGEGAPLPTAPPPAGARLEGVF